jgi:hypothetical protein
MAPAYFAPKSLPLFDVSAYLCSGACIWSEADVGALRTGGSPWDESLDAKGGLLGERKEGSASIQQSHFNGMYLVVRSATACGEAEPGERPILIRKLINALIQPKSSPMPITSAFHPLDR